MLQISSIPVVYMVRNGDLIDEFMGVPKDPKKAIAAFVDKGLAATDSKDEKK
jgi:thioredoxin-like negative regulator of GroEL